MYEVFYKYKDMNDNTLQFIPFTDTKYLNDFHKKL